MTVLVNVLKRLCNKTDRENINYNRKKNKKRRFKKDTSLWNFVEKMKDVVNSNLTAILATTTHDNLRLKNCWQCMTVSTLYVALISFTKRGNDNKAQFVSFSGFSICLTETYWWRGSVIQRRSLAGKLSLSCARPAADGWPLMWVSHPLQVSQLGQLSLSSFRGR